MAFSLSSSLARAVFRRPTTLYLSSSRLYSTDVGKAQADELLQQAETRANDAFVGLNEEEDFSETVWPPRVEKQTVDLSLLDIDARTFLSDDTPVELDQLQRLSGGNPQLTELVSKLRTLARETEAEDPLRETLSNLGLAGVAYHRGGAPSINWDFYSKHLDSKMVANLKKSYETNVKQAEEMIPIIKKDAEETTSRLREVFVEEIEKMQKDVKLIVDEIDRVDKCQEEVLEFGSRLRDINVQEEITTNEQEFNEIVEQQMVEGRWGVDDEDIPEPPSGAADNTLQRSLEKTPEEEEATRENLREKVSKAFWG